MGELLLVLGESSTPNLNFEIELNKANAEGLPRSIHIQNHKGRIDLDEKEFFRLACTYLEAKKKFEILKRIK